MEVSIKYSGKTYAVPVSQETTTQSFKDAISQMTRVPSARMKVMLKGKLLKDDVDFVYLASQKPAIMVIGTAEALLEPPAQKTVFLEDMGDIEIPSGEEPTGLINLGNTCYLNSTLQALRALPDVHQALKQFTPAGSSPESRLTSSLKSLFVTIDNSAEAAAPFELLNNLRILAPQFSERDSRGQFAQQDADEAWTCLVSALRSSLSSDQDTLLVDKLMSIELTKTQSLNQQVEKTSPVLGRDATYQMQSRISRLPEYLVVHMVRFYWRRDIQKKAKIMRKVKYPLQLDLYDIATDELRSSIQPVNTATKQILKERDDRAKILKRKPREGAQEEEKKREEERKNIEQLIRESGAPEPKGYGSGVYELSAVVTHKGASADSGHYIGWARMNDDSLMPLEEQKWAKFDDQKVSFVDANKITSMDGGGEDSVAYILVYRAANIL
ncbi:uncharacterized protein L203_105243 [Cryptococcus depauperatus CBS 7841]|uniref:Ubiquitin carboxyl-terminal hydrolase n=1 Tax=Cryptococcus depauperatus CBS 7841 TaxID=1295531 RepID=A0AAJ8JX47_9TREE